MAPVTLTRPQILDIPRDVSDGRAYRILLRGSIAIETVCVLTGKDVAHINRCMDLAIAYFVPIRAARK